MTVRLVIMGAPGSGKGSQGIVLSRQFGIPAVSTGDVFRKHVRDETPLGVVVRAFIDSGQYVPDSVTNELVRVRLSESDARCGFVLDGYPRTLSQARELDNVLAESEKAIDAVVYLDTKPDELVRRLTNRADLEARSDDDADTIHRRMAVYHRETVPVLDLYRARKILVEIDGHGRVDEVSRKITTALLDVTSNAAGHGAERTASI